MENAIKANLLGMPFGTANGRLRKNLIFYLAGKLDMLSCYRCQQTIEAIEDFSIEHTKSWQFAENPIEAFFDVENIAFSHLICNTQASKAGSYRKEKCHKGHIYSSLVKTKGCKDGVGQRCKECHAAHQQNYRETGRDKYRPLKVS